MPWWTFGVIVWVGYGGFLVALLWIAANRWGDALDGLATRAARAVMGVPSTVFVAAASLATVLLGVGVAIYCYAGRGFSGDEMAMTWHARMLVAGHLSIRSTAHPEFFNAVSVLERDGRWFSQYPIGGPALVALGLSVGAIWLEGPLLLGLATWQLHRFGRRAFGESTARAATLLFVLSPFVLVLGATQMNHTPAMAFTLLALAELAAWDEPAARARRTHGVVLGLAVGCVALVRPLDAALVAVPIASFQLVRMWRDHDRWSSIALQCAAGAVPVAILLWANARTTGSPLLFGYDAAHGPTHALGFHVDPHGERHTPVRGLVYMSGYLMRFDRFLFEWPLPALLVVCVTLATLRRASRWDTLLLALLGCFLVGYAAYWHNGFFDGPRFLFPVAPVLVVYAARLPEAAAGMAREAWRRVGRVLVPACVLCAWVVPLSFSSVPGRLVAQRDQRTKLKTNVVEQADEAGLGDAVVFVREPWRGRLLARLRGLGVRQFDAERLVDDLDACALQTALDEADAAPATDSTARRARVIARARSAGAATSRAGMLAEAQVARAPGGPDTPRCRDEAAADTLGTMPYAVFLREQRVTRDGRLGGSVVWARDLGPRDTLLRSEFGARRWYLYKPARALDGKAEFIAMH